MYVLEFSFPFPPIWFTFNYLLFFSQLLWLRTIFRIKSAIVICVFVWKMSACLASTPSGNVGKMCTYRPQMFQIIRWCTLHIGESTDTLKRQVMFAYWKWIFFCYNSNHVTATADRKNGTKWRQIAVNAWNLPEKCFCHVHAMRGSTL